MKKLIISVLFIIVLFIVYAFSYFSKTTVPKPVQYIQGGITETAPEIKAERWINSDKDLTLELLKGKVVLIEFWTYGCYNCRNTIPYINNWYSKYKDKGLEIIGIHCPEFNRERDFDNVNEAVAELGIQYPVAIDNEFYNWYRYDVNAWPTLFVIDKKGEIIHKKQGEGGYKKTEEIINENLQ